jgi:protein TonB
VALSASSHDPGWRLLNWPLLALVLVLHGAVLFMLSRHEGMNERIAESTEAPQFQVSLLANAPHSLQNAIAAGDAPDKRQRTVDPGPPSPSAQAVAAPQQAAERAPVTPAASTRIPAADAATSTPTPAPVAAASKPAPAQTRDQGSGQNPKPTVDKAAAQTSPLGSSPFGGSSRAASAPDGGPDGVANGPRSNPDRSPDSSPLSSPEPGQKTRQNLEIRQDLAGHGQAGIDAQDSFGTPSRAAPASRTQPRVDASWTGNAPPPYPPLARRLKLEGEVWLSVHVAADGRVLQVSVARSSGHDMLDTTAVESVKKWRFEPATLDGKPVAEWYHNWHWHFRIHD